MNGASSLLQEAPLIARALMPGLRPATKLTTTTTRVGAGLADRMVPLTDEEVAAADLVVVLTDHDAFDYAMVEQSATHVLDCRRVPELVSAERL